MIHTSASLPYTSQNSRPGGASWQIKGHGDSGAGRPRSRWPRDPNNYTDLTSILTERRKIEHEQLCVQYGDRWRSFSADEAAPAHFFQVALWYREGVKSSSDKTCRASWWFKDRRSIASYFSTFFTGLFVTTSCYAVLEPSKEVWFDSHRAAVS